MVKAPNRVDTASTALFLDVDGTLLAIEDRPQDVVADADLTGLLEALLLHFEGAMALVSGRSIADLDRIFGSSAFPAAGAHGAELRGSGRMPAGAAAKTLPAPVVGRLQNLADGHDGLLLEHKHGGVSLHYRRAPELAEVCRSHVVRLMSDISADFRLIEGKMVFEIAPRQHNKGAAIRELLKSSAFTGRIPVFIGDDVTDEDGFSAVNELAGVSIKVGNAADSAAQFGLPDVAAVRRWLHTLTD